MALILSVTEPKVCPGARTGTCARSRGGSGRVVAIGRGLLELLELGVRVAQPGQVARARPGVELGQQGVVPRVVLGLPHVAGRVVEVAEDDRPGRAGPLAGRLDLVAGDRAAALDLRL